MKKDKLPTPLSCQFFFLLKLLSTNLKRFFNEVGQIVNVIKIIGMIIIKNIFKLLICLFY